MSDSVWDKCNKERQHGKPFEDLREIISGPHALGLQINYLPMLSELLDLKGLENSSSVVRQVINLLDEIHEALGRLERSNERLIEEDKRYNASLNSPDGESACPWCAKYRKYKLEDLLSDKVQADWDQLRQESDPYPGAVTPTELSEWAHKVNPFPVAHQPIDEERIRDQQAAHERYIDSLSQPLPEKTNSCIGSSFDEWLDEEGIREEVQIEAKRRIQDLDYGPDYEGPAG